MYLKAIIELQKEGGKKKGKKKSFEVVKIRESNDIGYDIQIKLSSYWWT